MYEGLCATGVFLSPEVNEIKKSRCFRLKNPLMGPFLGQKKMAGQSTQKTSVINLQILEGDELDVLSKIKKKDNISVYWNKIYEPDVIAKGKKIRDAFIKNEVEFKYFKGNILNEFQEVTKNDGTPFKVFSPFWRNAEEKYLSLPPSKNYVVKKKN